MQQVLFADGLVVCIIAMYYNLFRCFIIFELTTMRFVIDRALRDRRNPGYDAYVIFNPVGPAVRLALVDCAQSGTVHTLSCEPAYCWLPSIVRSRRDFANSRNLFRLRCASQALLVVKIYM